MRPLEGIRVLELANYMAGPYAGMLLGDMGADVLKIENPKGGDFTRNNPPFINGEAAGFMALNRNKRSVALNLKHDEGKQAFMQLVETADVVVENFRPGTMDDLGLGPARLRAANPRLIYSSATAFGQTGPYSQRAGFDLIAQGMSGLMSITGEPGGRPVKVGVPIADLACAQFCVYGILAAYIHRLKTGQGQEVEGSLLESAVALSVWETSGYFATGEVPKPLGSAHRTAAPYQAVRTRDGHVTIGAQTPNTWTLFCQAIGRPELTTDERFKENPLRMANLPVLIEIIEAVTITRTSAEWYALLEAAGVPCGILNDYAAVAADPHLNGRGFFIDVEHPRAGQTRATGFPVRLSATPASLGRPAPLLGEHTDEVLASIGFDAAAIAALRAGGAIG